MNFFAAVDPAGALAVLLLLLFENMEFHHERSADTVPTLRSPLPSFDVPRRCEEEPVRACLGLGRLQAR